MSTLPPPFATDAQGYAIDSGLRAHMSRVYNYMAGATALSGFVAWFSAESGLYLSIIAAGPIAMFAVMLSPLAVMLFLTFRARTMTPGGTQLAFWIFASLMGLSLASIVLIYTAASITQAFLLSAVAFLSLSLYGYLTKRNLSAMGAFFFMGLIGIILAMVANLFIQSSGLNLAISVLGVLIFAGLTAYDTQRIKNGYLALAQAGAGEGVVTKTAVMSALTLYLNFLNMFLFLLRLVGDRR